MSCFGKVFDSLTSKIQRFQRFKNVQLFLGFILIYRTNLKRLKWQKIANLVVKFFKSLICHVLVKSLTAWKVKFNVFKDSKMSSFSWVSFWSIEAIWEDWNGKKLLSASFSFETVNYVFLLKKASLVSSNVSFLRFRYFRRINLALNESS